MDIHKNRKNREEFINSIKKVDKLTDKEEKQIISYSSAHVLVYDHRTDSYFNSASQKEQEVDFHEIKRSHFYGKTYETTINGQYYNLSMVTTRKKQFHNHKVCFIVPNLKNKQIVFDSMVAYTRYNPETMKVEIMYTRLLDRHWFNTEKKKLYLYNNFHHTHLNEMVGYNQYTTLTGTYLKRPKTHFKGTPLYYMMEFQEYMDSSTDDLFPNGYTTKWRDKDDLITSLLDSNFETIFKKYGFYVASEMRKGNSLLQKFDLENIITKKQLMRLLEMIKERAPYLKISHWKDYVTMGRRYMKTWRDEKDLWVDDLTIDKRHNRFINIQNKIDKDNKKVIDKRAANQRALFTDKKLKLKIKYLDNVYHREIGAKTKTCIGSQTYFGKIWIASFVGKQNSEIMIEFNKEANKIYQIRGYKNQEVPEHIQNFIRDKLLKKEKNGK